MKNSNSYSCPDDYFPSGCATDVRFIWRCSSFSRADLYMSCSLLRTLYSRLRLLI